MCFCFGSLFYTSCSCCCCCCCSFSSLPNWVIRRGRPKTEDWNKKNIKKIHKNEDEDEDETDACCLLPVACLMLPVACCLLSAACHKLNLNCTCRCRYKLKLCCRHTHTHTYTHLAQQTPTLLWSGSLRKPKQAKSPHPPSLCLHISPPRHPLKQLQLVFYALHINIT